MLVDCRRRSWPLPAPPLRLYCRADAIANLVELRVRSQVPHARRQRQLLASSSANGLLLELVVSGAR